METSSEASGTIPSKKPGFIPQETIDYPFDVTLVVEDGKELKAHRGVLSKGSTFFEKLLDNGMKESTEGVIRLEMLSEFVMRQIMEFMYTGRVQISTEGNAQELMAIADYLVLPKLKTLAEKVLVEKLNVSNAISTYCLAEKYQCQQLVSDTKSFILANFTDVAKTEGFLNLSSEKVKMWIASDNIDVRTEEDVFKVIVTWVERDKSERKKNFAELFRQVRLVYVSRDYLRSDVVTNELVNKDEDCLDLVKDAIKFYNNERKDYHHQSVRPRKSLETPVAVICVSGFKDGERIVCCYYPREDMWSKFQGTKPPGTGENIISCRGKLYFISKELDSISLLCYDSFSNCWTRRSHKDQRTLWEVFVTNNEFYALLRENMICCPECISLFSRGTYEPCGRSHLSFIAKFNPESGSWEDISSFDLGERKAICVVARENYVYFLGGYANDRNEPLRDVDRYDITTNAWDKIADLQVPRWYAHAGGAAYNSVFIVGGGDRYRSEPEYGEMYNETTNEWQFISNPRKTIFDDHRPTVLGVDNKLYSIICCTCNWNRKYRIECYDPDTNEWIEKSQIPLEKLFSKAMIDGAVYLNFTFLCPMRVFKHSEFLKHAAIPDDYSKLGWQTKMCYDVS